MQQIIVRGTAGNKTILAIKALRQSAGIGLREAKTIVDDGNAGTPTKVMVSLEALTADPNSAELAYEVVPSTALRAFIARLEQFPGEMTVRELRALLRTVETEFSA